MNAGENRGANNREERHRFRRAIDRGAPFLAEQKQDRRNESAGVSDTDPENEVGDVPRPADRVIQSPGADAGGNLIAEAEQTEHRDRSTVIANATHHQRGAGFSTAPEMRLVIQPKLRLFRTSGTRASGRSTEAEASPAITSGAVVAPSIYDYLASESRLCASRRCCEVFTVLDAAVSRSTSLRSVLRSCSLSHASSSEARDRDRSGIRHFRIRIANPREITRARFHIQIFEQPVIAVLCSSSSRRGSPDRSISPKTIASVGQACAQARRERIARNQRLVRGAGAHVRGDLRFLDPLHAIGALLHHAAHPHGDVRILLQLHVSGAPFSVSGPRYSW